MLLTLTGRKHGLQLKWCGAVIKLVEAAQPQARVRPLTATLASRSGRLAGPEPKRNGVVATNTVAVTSMIVTSTLTTGKDSGLARRRLGVAKDMALDVAQQLPCPSIVMLLTTIGKRHGQQPKWRGVVKRLAGAAQPQAPVRSLIVMLASQSGLLVGLEPKRSGVAPMSIVDVLLRLRFALIATLLSITGPWHGQQLR